MDDHFKHSDWCFKNFQPISAHKKLWRNFTCEIFIIGSAPELSLSEVPVKRSGIKTQDLRLLRQEL